MTKRNMVKYRQLFDKYLEIDELQDELYKGKIFLPEEYKVIFNQLQVKKIAILEEMGKCYENTRSDAISLRLI